MMETLTRLWRKAPQPAVLQLARSRDSDWAASALPQARRRLCREIRRKVPVADAALDKIVRLTGEFIVQSDDALVEEELRRFCREIAIGAGRQGLRGFLEQYLNSLLTDGTAVAEMIPAADGTGLGAVLLCPAESLAVRRAENGVGLRFYAARDGLPGEEVRWPELILYTPLDPDAGEVWGHSVLEGLEAVSRVWEQILRSTAQNFERAGSLRYAVTYRPGEGERINPREVAETMAREWRAAMDGSSGSVSDFVAVGNVKIQTIGADNQILDSEVPVRQMLEQIIAKLSIPPFLLGLSWSTTERMSAQQADILTSELEAYRRILNPVIGKVCSLWLRLHGYSPEHTVMWDDINLQDAVELSNARLLEARAKQIEQELKPEGELEAPLEGGTQ